MKKRVKNACSVRRYYPSGIPMYRHRNTPVDITAGTMVEIISVKTQLAICNLKVDKKTNIVVAIPNDNFQGDKVTREKAAKVIAKKTKKQAKAVAIETPVVAPETAPEAALPQETAVQAPVVETAPVVDTAPAEVPAEAAPIAEVPAEAPAVEVPVVA